MAPPRAGSPRPLKAPLTTCTLFKHYFTPPSCPPTLVPFSSESSPLVLGPAASTRSP
ncbi:hypothetical protein PCASD_18004 [Puccinia coronata f. sp. avenae]|uniref:Uncharacterized protein n=1 Tax=Puccinia coronata f. sp. avenae TaxID=200324 RepID=A0A2N5UC69_9BASI|nr:hypothetical protein PCASD_18004 [Puccinia coronata f. sp. avenae]